MLEALFSTACATRIIQIPYAVWYIRTRAGEIDASSHLPVTVFVIGSTAPNIGKLQNTLLMKLPLGASGSRKSAHQPIIMQPM